MISGFGMSETTFGLIEEPYGERRSGSMGKARQHPDPAFVNEARIVDDEGNEVAPGVTGELIIRNPAVMRGYFDDPEQTAEALRDGWLWTGDLARRDVDGFFFYVDRKKDIIRRRGENVSSLEVEVVLAAHPAVEEAAVVGVPSELTEEEILALVQLLPDASVEPAELAAWCRERLADFKVPRYVQLVDAPAEDRDGSAAEGTRAGGVSPTRSSGGTGRPGDARRPPAGRLHRSRDHGRGAARPRAARPRGRARRAALRRSGDPGRRARRSRPRRWRRRSRPLPS